MNPLDVVPPRKLRRDAWFWCVFALVTLPWAALAVVAIYKTANP